MLPFRLIGVLSPLCLALGVTTTVLAQSVGETPPSDQREDVALANPAGNSFGFGHSVAIDGDTLVVGAPYFAPAGSQLGTASIFIRSGATWALQQTLVGPSGLGFGGTVDVSGDTVIVGVSNYGSAPNHARIYARNGSVWTLQATLIPGDYVPGSGWQAHSVAIEGNTAVVRLGSAAAYVFVRTGATWTQQAKLTPAQAIAGDLGNRSVAVYGNTALVGVPFATVGANANQGAILVFVRSGTTWSQQAVLISSDGRASSRFGRTVALGADTALGLNGGSSSTRAYRFTRVGGAWTEQTPLVPPSTSVFPPNVLSVALDGDTAVVGAHFFAHVFRRVGGQWAYQDRLRSGHANNPLSELFGSASAISGSTALVGAPDYGRGEETNGPGRAYVYSIPSGPPGAPSLTGTVSGTTVHLSWTPPAGGAVPATYIVEAGSTPGASNIYASNVGNVRLLSTPAPPATYHVRVRGVNAFGPGAPSNEITLTVGTPAAPLPGPPTLTGSVAQTAVSLAWTAAATGGAPTSYVLEAGTSPGATNLFNANVGATTRLSATVTPAIYYVRVRGVNASGTGPASNEIVLTATGCARPATPTGLAFSSAGNRVTLTWNPAPGAAAYFLEAGTATGTSNVFNGTVGGATTVATSAPSGTYYVRVRGANACGVSAPTPEVRIVIP